MCSNFKSFKEKALECKTSNFAKVHFQLYTQRESENTLPSGDKLITAPPGCCDCFKTEVRILQQKFIKSNSEHFDKETLARARDEAVLRNIVYVGNIASLLKCTENINSNKVMIRVKVKVQGPQFLWISVTIHFKKNVHCPNFPLIHASWTQNWIANCKSRNIKI